MPRSQLTKCMHGVVGERIFELFHFCNLKSKSLTGLVNGLDTVSRREELREYMYVDFQDRGCMMLFHSHSCFVDQLMSQTSTRKSGSRLLTSLRSKHILELELPSVLKSTRAPRSLAKTTIASFLRWAIRYDFRAST